MPISDWLEKDRWESIICAQSLSCHEFFLLAEDGIWSFDRSDFKSRKMEGERKKFAKNWFLIVFLSGMKQSFRKIDFIVFFSIIKNVLDHYKFAKFPNIIWTNAISSPWSQILRCMGMICFCNIGTHSKQAAWRLMLFWVYLYQTLCKTFSSLLLFICFLSRFYRNF